MTTATDLLEDNSVPFSLDEGDWLALWDAITEIRDAAPRLPDDVPTDDIVDAAVQVLHARGLL